MNILPITAEATAVAEDTSTFIQTITGALSDFTSGNLATILVAALGITAALFMAWFAYRFIVRKASGGIKSGRL